MNLSGHRRGSQGLIWQGTLGNKAPSVPSRSPRGGRDSFCEWSCSAILTSSCSLSTFHSDNGFFEIPWERLNELEKFNWTLHTVLMNPWMLFQHFWTTGGKPWEGSQSPSAWVAGAERGQNLTSTVFLVCARHNTVLSHVASPQQTCETFTVEDIIYS